MFSVENLKWSNVDQRNLHPFTCNVLGYVFYLKWSQEKPVWVGVAICYCLCCTHEKTLINYTNEGLKIVMFLALPCNYLLFLKFAVIIFSPTRNTSQFFVYIELKCIVHACQWYSLRFTCKNQPALPPHLLKSIVLSVEVSLRNCGSSNSARYGKITLL